MYSDSDNQAGDAYLPQPFSFPFRECFLLHVIQLLAQMSARPSSFIPCLCVNRCTSGRKALFIQLHCYKETIVAWLSSISDAARSFLIFFLDRPSSAMNLMVCFFWCGALTAAVSMKKDNDRLNSSVPSRSWWGSYGEKAPFVSMAISTEANTRPSWLNELAAEQQVLVNHTCQKALTQTIPIIN